MKLQLFNYCYLVLNICELWVFFSTIESWHCIQWVAEKGRCYHMGSTTIDGPTGPPTGRKQTQPVQHFHSIGWDGCQIMVLFCLEREQKRICKWKFDLSREKFWVRGERYERKQWIFEREQMFWVQRHEVLLSDSKRVLSTYGSKIPP